MLLRQPHFAHAACADPLDKFIRADEGSGCVSRGLILRWRRRHAVLGAHGESRLDLRIFR
jgi:hypothetical protein